MTNLANYWRFAIAMAAIKESNRNLPMENLPKFFCAKQSRYTVFLEFKLVVAVCMDSTSITECRAEGETNNFET